MSALPFIGLVLLTFVMVVAVPCNLLSLPLLRLLDRMRPQARSPLLLLLVAAPWLMGGGVLLSSTADVVFGACGEDEMCLWNGSLRLEANGPERLVIVLLVIVVARIAIVGIRLGLQLIQSRRAILALERTSLHDPADNVYVVPTPNALAFAVRDKVFVSSGLRAALDPAQFRAVLLHERAHLERADNAFQLITRVLSCALLPPVRRRVLDALTLANEQACDEAAGKTEGRLVTASAILSAERLHSARSLVLSPAFAESFVARRVRRLMEPEPASWRITRVYGAIICGVLSMFLLGDLVYYAGMLLLFPVMRGSVLG